MPETMVCWKCGGELKDLLLPLPRIAECPLCRAQLHVCRMCAFYDPAAGQQCREPIAEAVRDKQRANFCGYFRINPHAYTAPSDQATAARAQLDALFGGDAATPKEGSRSAADLAREQLEQLFKKP